VPVIIAGATSLQVMPFLASLIRPQFFPIMCETASLVRMKLARRLTCTHVQYLLPMSRNGLSDER
jgi:hypothetical protein